jgi:hypothetical protein
MPVYKVKIEFSGSWIRDIEAESKHDAEIKAIEKWEESNEGEIDLLEVEE